MNKGLSVNAGSSAFPRFRPHITKTIRLGKLGVKFPLKERHDRINCTLDGLEEFAQPTPFEVELTDRVISVDEVSTMFELLVYVPEHTQTESRK